MKDVVVVVELKKAIGHERCSSSGGVEKAISHERCSRSGGVEEGY